MAITKADITLQASGSNAAGATATGAGIDLTGGYGGHLLARITNGATAPTLPCKVIFEASNDNSNWFAIGSYAAGVTNFEVYEFGFDVPLAVQYIRTVFEGNTGQAVTVECVGSHVTAV